MESAHAILQAVVTVVGTTLDVIGCLIIALGTFYSLAKALTVSGTKKQERYRTLRLRIARSILLGLELLVAGDIVRTVAVSPTLSSLAVLAGIVVIRTFLSFAMELEMHSRWPWQRKPTSQND
jgi:uncharacterized membrane protein